MRGETAEDLSGYELRRHSKRAHLGSCNTPGDLLTSASSTLASTSATGTPERLYRSVSLRRTFGRIQYQECRQLTAPLQTDLRLPVLLKKHKCRCFAFGRAPSVVASAWPTMLGYLPTLATATYHHGHHQPCAAGSILNLGT